MSFKRTYPALTALACEEPDDDGLYSLTQGAREDLVAAMAERKALLRGPFAEAYPGLCAAAARGELPPEALEELDLLRKERARLKGWKKRADEQRAGANAEASDLERELAEARQVIATEQAIRQNADDAARKARRERDAAADELRRLRGMGLLAALEELQVTARVFSLERVREVLEALDLAPAFVDALITHLEKKLEGNRG